MSRYNAGGMTSPAAYPPNGSVRSFSHSPGPMSPPPVGSGGRGILPDSWPHDQGLISSSLGRQSPPQVIDSEYAKVQAERASLEVQLHSADTRLREASTRETCLVNQLQRERSQHTQTVQVFLDTFRELCSSTIIPQAVPTPEKATTLSVSVINELNNNLQDSDLAADSARVAVKKVEELTVAIRDRDICIATLEHKIAQQRDFDSQKAAAVEQQIQILLQTVNSKSDTSFVAEPSQRTGENIDDSLLNWVDTSNNTLPKESPIEPTPQPLMSPARERSPYNSHPRQIKTPAYATNSKNNNPTPVTHGDREGDWPGSPRREVEETLNQTLPEEFPPSPRRQVPNEQPEHGKDWRMAGEEWPPSPRRVDTESYPSPDRLRETSTMEPKNWGNDTEEWPPSPQRVRESQTEERQQPTATAAGSEWPPSPQRVRGAPEPEEAITAGEEWPPSPQRHREPVEETCPAPTYAEENKEWPPSPQRQRGGAPPAQEGEAKEWPPSPQRQRGVAPSEQNETNENWQPSPRRERNADTETYANGAPKVNNSNNTCDPDTPVQVCFIYLTKQKN